MTYIPGTGSVSDPNDESKNSYKPEVLTSINVKELKNPTIPEIKESEWYLQLKYWMIFGGVFSLIFVGMSLIDSRFLFLLPLGPYTGYLSWHIRKWLKKHSDKFDSLA